MTASVPHLLGGRYEVGELLGRGGMAEVHYGYDTRLGRPVAIKILRSDHVRDTTFLSRFRREAQSVAGLNHPAVVAVYDSGEDHTIESGGARVPVPYIVMEYVPGVTLRELLNDRGALDPDEAARITEAVLSALDYSHRMGIVHRDIKPANVMLADDGAVKVMDFGIARAIADTAATMTATSSVMGTAQYISPEQAEGLTVDSRSDIYSAGCLLFELLTGRTPFVGEPVSLTYQHVAKAPPLPSALNEAVPTEFDAIVLHALAKNRDNRYQDAEKFRADLFAARHGRAISPAAQAALAQAADTAIVAPTPGSVHDASTSPTMTYAASDTSSLPAAYAPPRRSRGAVWLTVLALLASLGLFGFVGKAYLDNRPKQIAVPSVVGDPVDTAKARIAKAGFDVTEQYVPNKEVPADEVFKQDPGPLTLHLEGTLVTLTVSGGPASTRVPDLVGTDLEEATALIEDAGLTMGSVDTVDSPDQQENHVVSATPAPFADAAEGDTVSLKVASGKVSLGDLRTMREDEARNTLGTLKLPVVTETALSDEPEGTVIKQSPEPGRIDVGTAVTITLAKPRPVTETTTVTTTQSSTTSTTTTSTSTSTSSTTTANTSTSPPGTTVSTTPLVMGSTSSPVSPGVRVGPGAPASGVGVVALGFVVCAPILLVGRGRSRRTRRRH